MKLSILVLAVLVVVAINCSTPQEKFDGFRNLVQQWHKDVSAVHDSHMTVVSTVKTHHKTLTDHLHSRQVKDTKLGNRAVPNAACASAINAVLTNVDYAKCLVSATLLYNPLRTAAQRTAENTNFCTTLDCDGKLKAGLKKITQDCKLSRKEIITSVTGRQAMAVGLWARSACIQVGGEFCITKFYNAITSLGVTDGSALTAATLAQVCTPCTFKVIRAIGNAGSNQAGRPGALSLTAVAVAKKGFRAFCKKRNGEFCIVKVREITASVLADIKTLTARFASFTGVPTEAQINALIAEIRPVVESILGKLCHPCVKTLLRSFASTGSTSSLNLGTFGGFLSVCQKAGGKFCIAEILFGQPSTFFLDVTALTTPVNRPCANGLCDVRCKAIVDKYSNLGCCALALARIVPSNVQTAVSNAFKICDAKLVDCKFGCDRTFTINADVSNYRCELFDAAKKTAVGEQLCRGAQDLFGSNLPCDAFVATCDATTFKLNFEVKGPFCADAPVPLTDIDEPVNNGETFQEMEEGVSPEDLSVSPDVTFRSGGFASAMSVSGLIAFVVLVVVAVM